MHEKTKKVLVTGATGFIGKRLAERLLDEGWDLKLLVRNPAKLSPHLRDALHVIVGDLADHDALTQAVRDVSVVFHCAANVKTWDRPDAYKAANVEGVRNLLNAIAQTNPSLSRLVHVSTVDVYGFPKMPCDEEAVPVSGEFGYGSTKLEGETLVRAFCAEHGIPAVIIRPANVIGPESPFIERIGDALRSGLMLSINGGEANAGLVYVDNLVDDLVWAACEPAAIGQCYNIRDSYDVSWGEFLKTFRKAIHGRGLILDLKFFPALTLAKAVESFYRVFLPSREPLLHRLLVYIFGRTCGHNAEKIRSAHPRSDSIGYAEAIERSAKWFLGR